MSRYEEIRCVFGASDIHYTHPNGVEVEHIVLMPRDSGTARSIAGLFNLIADKLADSEPLIMREAGIDHSLEAMHRFEKEVKQ